VPKSERGAAGVPGKSSRTNAVDLLIEAGAALAGSLDLRTTMREVAKLTVPLLADICVIDLLDDEGRINDVAVVAADKEIAYELEQLRSQAPLDPNGEHPVARVIRGGRPELLAEMRDTSLRTFAESSAHAEFMIAHNYRSAVVVPLQARGRTLGAISILRLEPSKPFGQAEKPYGREDLELALELARRAALAIDNARLFSDLRRLEQRLEAILTNVAEAITVVDRAGQTIFANQAAADLLQVTAPSDLTNAERDTIMRRFLVLDEQGRELDLESMPGRRLFRGEDAKPQLVRNIVRATGEERWIMARSSPVADPDTGQMLYAVNVFEDVTTIKRAQLAERLLAEERAKIAHTLQRALLPESLPEIAGVKVETLYAAAGELNEVGGDFYDVFDYDDTQSMIVIGDVCGKGPRAAGVTALARHTLRAAAIGGQSASEMLATLHQALLRQPPGADLCTVCLIMLVREQGGARLTIALAGHPPPLLIRENGEVEQVGRSGTVLGVISPVSIEESKIELERGETLLLYTDGVIEAGRPSRLLGEDGLLELCAAAPVLPLAEFLEYIEQAALTRAEGRLHDDIALLALRIDG
jgi:serine phosphatase RsbU (regulator of sigma subunit)/PAS domain-containing protein